LLRRGPTYVPYFLVLDYQVTSGQRHGSGPYAEAVVKLQVGTQILHTAAEGTGPVSALDIALRKALAPVYPAVHGVHLADYKVRILNGSQGTGAITRVLIDSQTESREFTTVGASSNIIEASLQALIDSLEFGLHDSGVRPHDAIQSSTALDSRPPARASTDQTDRGVAGD
jgi:2-isopropylmalate synthase